MLIRKVTSVLTLVLLILLSWLLFFTSQAALPLTLAQRPDTDLVPDEFVYEEQQAVYLTNLKRAAHGLPPLRWNRELTEAARWFSWDSVENRPGGYCGHDDTNGRAPWDRTRWFGYYGFSNAENAFCSYLTPEQAVEGWYNETPPNDGHRQNLLNTQSWEVGVGYYRRESNERGYVTQDFGVDPVYPPVVINHEAIQTGSPMVDLYIYSHREDEEGMTSFGPATEMMVSNEPCFLGTTWEPYSPHKSWSLESGTGWRTVYVATRDASGRSTVVSDTIYLGSTIPYEELSLVQASTRSDQVHLSNLGHSALPFMQFSLGWAIEMETGHLWWGNGEVVNDPDASAGRAYRLRSRNNNSFMWAIPTDYPRNLNGQAYFRLKVADNSTAKAVVRLSVKSNDSEEDKFLELKGTDFAEAAVYQEFSLDFMQHEEDDPSLIFGVEQYGIDTVHVDRVVAFTAPEPVQANRWWTVPGRNYRGQTVWVRYTDDEDNFSAITEAKATRSQLQASPPALTFLGDDKGTTPAVQTVTMNDGQRCGRPSWSVQSSKAWLKGHAEPPHVYVSVDAADLPLGTHQATVTVDVGVDVAGNPQTIPVTFHRVEQVSPVFLPLLVTQQK